MMYRYIATSLVLFGGNISFSQAQVTISSLTSDNTVGRADWTISNIEAGQEPTLVAGDVLTGPGTVEGRFNATAAKEDYFVVEIDAVSDWSTASAIGAADAGAYFGTLTEALFASSGATWAVDTGELANQRMFPLGEALIFTFNLSGLSPDLQDTFTLLDHEIQGEGRGNNAFDLLWYRAATNTIEILAEDTLPADFVLNAENPLDIENGDKLVYAVGASQIDSKVWRWRNMVVDFGIRTYDPPVVVEFDTYGGAAGSEVNTLQVLDLVNKPPTAGGDDQTYHLDGRFSDLGGLDDSSEFTITATAVESWDTATALESADIGNYLGGLTQASLNGGGDGWGVDSTLDDVLEAFNRFDVLGEAMLLNFDLSSLTADNDLTLNRVVFSLFGGGDRFDYLLIDVFGNAVVSSGTDLASWDAVGQLIIGDGYQLVIAYAATGNWRCDALTLDLGGAVETTVPALTSVEVSGSDLVVGFTGVDGVTYELAESADLTLFVPTGVTATTIGGIGTLTYEGGAAALQNFVRLEER